MSHRLILIVAAVALALAALVLIRQHAAGAAIMAPLLSG